MRHYVVFFVCLFLAHPILTDTVYILSPVFYIIFYIIRVIPPWPWIEVKKMEGLLFISHSSVWSACHPNILHIVLMCLLLTLCNVPQCKFTNTIFYTISTLSSLYSLFWFSPSLANHAEVLMFNDNKTNCFFRPLSCGKVSLKRFICIFHLIGPVVIS